MTNNTHNRLRQLRGLITIDPWHEGSSCGHRVNLHAYVHLDEARLGGQAGDEVAFRLLLRQAEIKFLQTEPKSFEIDPREIWRGDSDTSGKITRTSETTFRDGRALEVSGSLNPTNPSMLAKISRDGSATTTNRLELVAEQSTKTISVSFQRNRVDQPTWILKPASNSEKIEDIPVLKGQPWDDKNQRLLSALEDKDHKNREMLSSIKLAISCRREDIIFHDIRVRNNKGEFEPIKDKSIKKLIVQEYLRKSLIAEGLPGSDMNNPFSIVYLGESVSEYRKSAE